ncbi:hypothetical protein [Natronincola ferrireducens]|uniref:Uncharacterized protein n=1 Tax=Natronincola ferrireducens TaxID=393762 RepID=A0A1G9GYF4_9FIRM|nr:hypothetical protein [Natronincola ferrireducens]SDL05697.1 hypothetical protein SAMN05660472_02528 [Natronincola ferrireducens]
MDRKSKFLKPVTIVMMTFIGTNGERLMDVDMPIIPLSSLPALRYYKHSMVN